MKVVVDFDACASNAVCMGILPRGLRGPRRRLPLHPGGAPPRIAAREARGGGAELPDAGDLHRRRRVTAPRHERAAGAVRAITDRLVPRRQRTNRPLQLAVRAPAGWDVHPADRGHRHRAQPTGMGGRHRRRAGLAGHGARRGPVLQSDRGERYQVAIERCGRPAPLYACDCTREDVDARTKGNPTPGYDGHCRTGGWRAASGRALRFRVPASGTTVVHDLVRGEVTFPHAAMEDFVCVKSTGQPLFVLANVVDDRDMAISHVIRGEDLLPTTPKGMLVWQALDAAVPARRADRPARLRPPADAGERAAQEAVQARRRPGGRVLPRPGVPAGGLPQLPGPARVEPAGPEREGRPRHPDPRVPAGRRPPRAGLLRREEARAPERGVHPGAARRALRRCHRAVGQPGRDGAVEAAVAAPPWPPERFDPAHLRSHGAARPGAGDGAGRRAGHGRLLVPGGPGDRSGQLARSPATRWRPRSCRVPSPPTRPASGRPKRCDDASLAVWQGFEASSKRSQAPIRVAVTGRTVGPPLFEPWSSWVETRFCAGSGRPSSAGISLTRGHPPHGVIRG